LKKGGREEKEAAGLWIRLVKCYGLVLREVSRPQRGLTLPQFDCLAQLLRHPEGLTAGDLSRSLLVTAGNLTGIVGRLQARGLVSRRPHPRDRRAALLFLTPHGHRLALVEVARHERRLARLFTGLPPAGRLRLRMALDRLRETLEPRPLRRSA
jgi:DNA-binding MarR family transcriptional regulator